MKLSPKVLRYFFYGLVVMGAGMLCMLFTVNTYSAASTRLWFNPLWLVAGCCVVPFVLAGIALANESR
ncbi:MAG: hypothetical protein AAF125_12570 [Chloroflexota bacterium]